MAKSLGSLTTPEVCSLLKESGFDTDVVETFQKNKIDGTTFLDLDADDLKVLGVVALGDRKRIQKLKEAAAESFNEVC